MLNTPVAFTTLACMLTVLSALLVYLASPHQHLISQIHTPRAYHLSAGASALFALISWHQEYSPLAAFLCFATVSMLSFGLLPHIDFALRTHRRKALEHAVENTQ